jgi:two-component system response regulator HydG
MKKKILVVDDELSHRQMLDAVLSEEGYDIREADDGETAIAAVEESFYDLIIISNFRLENCIGGFRKILKN